QTREATFGGEIFNRTNHVVDIDDQRRRAVGKNRRRAHVLHLAQSRIQCEYYQFAFKQKSVYYETVTTHLISEYNHRENFVRERRVIQSKHLMGRNQTDLFAVKTEMLTSFRGLNPIFGYSRHGRNARQGNGVFLAADFEHQSTNYGKRQRQFESKLS